MNKSELVDSVASATDMSKLILQEQLMQQSEQLEML